MLKPTTTTTTMPPTLNQRQPLTIRTITRLAELACKANIFVIAMGLNALADSLADGNGRDQLPEHILNMLNK